ncbi:MAG TPA: phosphate ABC transporter permease subunit PstC [Bacteroidales bacterium]|nr:phosphate ABC transporter permease subunit PstC [Bacteroidales bacterium]
MRRILGKIVEGMLTLSGMVTTVTILLIIIFLFKEGAGLFKSPVVEEGYQLYVHSSNPVNSLTPIEIKQMFDVDIDNWKTVGGENSEIMVFRFDDIFNLYSDEEFGSDYELLPVKLEEVISQNKNIIAFLPSQYAPKAGVNVKNIEAKKISIFDFFGGKEWIPTSKPAHQFGVLPLIWGTLLVSIVAILIALPLGIGVAIYLSELAQNRARHYLKFTIELLAGIPSVVYGFFGLVVIVPIVQRLFQLDVGETALTGSIILAIMALPTIITVSEDAMRNTPKSLREGSLALGANKWQTIYRVVIPSSISGISAAVVLGIGRAIGETMAVLMVTGNAAILPPSLFEPVRTIPATIAAELGEAPTGGTHYQALFLLGCILFVITMVISVVAEMISKKPQNSGV